jgi:flagellar hook assembly protein FlgD
LDIYNINGQKIISILNDEFPAGLQKITWQGNDSQGNRLKKGVYFYHLKIGEYEVIKKLVFMDK